MRKAQRHAARYNCYNTSMKILYVITTTDVGGAEQSLVSLVRCTAKEHTVRVVCLKPLGVLAQALRSSGADVISLEMKGVGFGVVSQLVGVLKSFRPDIVHAMLFRAIEFARLACAGRNIPLITTPHFDLSKKSICSRWLDRALKSIDNVSCAESVSTYNFLLQKQHYAAGKTVLLKNSVEKSLFFKDNFVKSRMRAEKKILDSQVVYICVARLVKIKQPELLLRAFSRILPNCPQAKLIYVGDGAERTALENFIQKHNLQDQVLLAGEQKNVNDWLNMADVFVLVSKEESLPIALLEAQQVGLPCIVSNVGDMPRQIEHGKNGFVCRAGDEMLLSCLLAELYENKDFRQKMGEYSLQKIAKIVDSSQQYQQLYQQMLKKQA